MSLVQILLLVLGAVIFAAGFIIPEKGGKKDEGQDLSGVKEDLDRMVEESVDNARKRINDIVTGECSIAKDDSERAMEKLSNEKIMAINEYGNTVVEEIERNHKEVLFLYDMLNEKSADIKNTVRKVDSISRENSVEKNTSGERRDFNAVPLPAKDRPALKAAIAGGIGKNSTAAVTKHENAVRDERRAAYGVISSVKAPAAEKESSDKGFKIPKMFAPAGNKNDRERPEGSGPSDPEMETKIMEMHENGVSDIDIAKKFGIGVGEVRLHIGVREAKEE